MTRREEDGVLYDVISHMVNNVVTALNKSTSVEVSADLAGARARAAIWAATFLGMLDSVIESKWFQGTLSADLNDGSWQMRIKAVRKIHTVDYRDGAFLFSTTHRFTDAKGLFYRIDMTDPNNPAIRWGQL